MLTPVYRGAITTTGSSEAIRFDKGLFRQNPEFRQKASVEAHVIGRGMLLVKVIGDHPDDDQSDDPMIGAFLAFLDRSVEENPRLIKPVTQSDFDEVEELVNGVVISDDDELP